MNVQNKRGRAFYYYHSLMLFMMAAIFYLSSQTAGESLAVSRGLFSWIMETVGFLLSTGFLLWLKTWIRKVAHFIAFLVLGLCASGMMKSSGRIRKDARFFLYLSGLTGWGIATVYAMTDEFHQLFVAGRSGQWSDVALDSSGALLGVALFILGCQIHRMIKNIIDRHKENS